MCPLKPVLDQCTLQKKLMNVVFNPLLTYFPPFLLRNSTTFNFLFLSSSESKFPILLANPNGVFPSLLFAFILVF